jgi:hypothetical protein
LGKDLVAITWVIPPALIGLSIAVPLSNSGDGWRIWWTMVRLVLLSCPAYGAIYLLLGTLMPRRGMVLAVAYTLILEFVVGFIPAVINKLTVQYRLRALFVRWCEIPVDEKETEVLSLIGNAEPWQHVLTLLLLTPTLLAVSVAVMRRSEFASSSETDV